MKRYDPDTHCVKCGGADIGTDHCAGRTPYGLACTHTDNFDRNHMVRRCRGCGYTWAEAPLDAESKVEAAA